MYNCASFLLDTKEDQTPTQSSFPLLYIENDDDSNTKVVAELTFVNECSVDGKTLVQEELAPARVDGASSLTSWPSVQVPALKTFL
ncbi:hypothetical protein Pmani_003728 [Petrolisthes manimaculis]|uniref:Uncharacterized protein n=1 Tax=Petrolisthes manimaculis TaxID=1843537 RepID=A0AAE1QFK0_9EUCA|nr:hypothetical protein Pmani_003728 [Petrolisthes manimaculis]